MESNTKACLMLCLVLVTIGMSHAGGLGDLGAILGKINNVANALGTEGKGDIDRGNGCTINWSFKGMLVGIKYKYMGVCTDKCTGLVATSMTKSKTGAIEHCMHDLYGKLAARHEL